MSSEVDGPDALPADRAVGDLSAHDLDQRLAGAFERIGHLTRTMIAKQAYQEGVSPLQLQLLMRLGSGVAGPRVSDLAVELDISQATISDALSTMRRKGLVAKEQDPADRRNSVFSLTGDGARLRERLAQWEGPLVERLTSVENDAKATALRVALGLIADLQGDGFINVARTCMTCRFFDPTTHPDDAQPYHCTLLDVAFADEQLRVDCAEHEPAS